jgi:hypothetical protein
MFSWAIFFLKYCSVHTKKLHKMKVNIFFFLNKMIMNFQLLVANVCSEKKYTKCSNVLLTSESKKPRQISVVIHYCDLSPFF